MNVSFPNIRKYITRIQDDQGTGISGLTLVRPTRLPTTPVMRWQERGDKKRVSRAEAVVHSQIVYSVVFVRAYARTGRLRRDEIYHA